MVGWVAMRQLGPGDEDTLRGLRLRALRDAPEHFTSTYDREAARTDAQWGRWLSPGATFVAEDTHGAAVGLVAAVRDEGEPDTVHLMALWVDPTSRGTGVGDALVAAVLGWAEAHAMARTRLHVMAANGPARDLYVRHGFRAVSEVARDGVRQVVMECP